MVGKATVLSEWGMQGIDIQQCNAIANSIPQFRTDLWQEIRGSRVVPGQILALIKKAATAFQSTDGEERSMEEGCRWMVAVATSTTTMEEISRKN